MMNMTPTQDIAAAWFVSGDGVLFSKTSTVVRDDQLERLHTDVEKKGFYFVLVGKEVTSGQVAAVESFAEILSKRMNGISDDTTSGESNRNIICSSILAFCRETGFGLFESTDELPYPFRVEDVKKRVFIFLPLTVG